MEFPSSVLKIKKDVNETCEQYWTCPGIPGKVKDENKDKEMLNSLVAKIWLILI